MKCEEYNNYSVLCQACEYPDNIKCCKRTNFEYEFSILKDRRVTKSLNIDKIQSLDDIKRIIAALDIKFELTEDTYNKAYELVKDLCD